MSGPKTPKAAKVATETLHVELGERGYDIVIGPDLIASAGGLMAPVLKQPRVVVVTDQNVAPHYLPLLMASLEDAGISAASIILPPGEEAKSHAQLEALCERLLEQKVERDTTLVALGGGVIGDLVGFAAAITLRGIAFVQVPTTLLSQVDSSVGGKTGINSPHGKNLIGAFYQPRLVIADTKALDTLPPREVLSGYAEVVKYGLIGDIGFFDWLEQNGESIIKGNDDARTYAIRTSCAAKAKVVAADEREGGQRALLNLGHTFGHALEAETGYSDKLLHGEAVAIGTVMAFDLSRRLGLCPDHDVQRVQAHFAKVGLPVDLSAVHTTEWAAKTLVEHMGRDKKVADGKLTFILLRAIGNAFITNDVDEGALNDVVEAFISK